MHRFRNSALACLALAAVACSGNGAARESAPMPSPRTGGDRQSATPTLDGVRRNGFVQCGVSTGIAGFSTADARGQWRGLDVDVCRAIAAAVLGDAAKVRFTPLTSPQRFTALQTGEIDVLSRVTTITFQRDVQLGIEFPATNWYDGSTFIVRKALKLSALTDLNGATICLQPGTTNEVDVADYFRKKGLTFKPVVFERLEEGINAYFAGRCDAFAQDQATLASVRARAPDPGEHVIMSEAISKAPYGPGVMPNDIRWMEIVRWSVFAMVDAEELGLSSTTIDQARASADPDVQRFVGTREDLGAMLGLDAEWAIRIVKQVGNYAEVSTAASSHPESSAASIVCGRTASVRAGPAVNRALRLSWDDARRVPSPGRSRWWRWCAPSPHRSRIRQRTTSNSVDRVGVRYLTRGRLRDRPGPLSYPSRDSYTARWRWDSSTRFAFLCRILVATALGIVIVVARLSKIWWCRRPRGHMSRSCEIRRCCCSCSSGIRCRSRCRSRAPP